MEASKAKQKKSGGAARKSQSNAQKNSITNYFGKAASKGTDLGLPMVQDSKMHLKNEDNVQRQSQQSVKTRSQKQDEDEEMKMEGVEPIDQSQYSQSINEEVNFGELLKEMGYQFTGQDQELRQLKTNDRFEFSNQDEYDYLCQLIIGYIQQQMIQKYGMVEVMIPEDEAGPKCNIFVSQNYFDDSVNKCFVIIQGTGEVRAGMWSRRVCINDNLNLGSMLPQIEWALSQGFKVIVFNPNMRKDPRFGQNIKNCQTMSSHCLYVWEKYVSPLKCKHLAVLAHSAGGRCVADLYFKFKKDFLGKVKALVFTDSFYHGMLQDMRLLEQKWAQSVGIHYKKFFKNRKPLGEIFQKQNGIIFEVSAGTDQHELTTGYSHEKIIEFIENKFAKL